MSSPNGRLAGSTDYRTPFYCPTSPDRHHANHVDDDSIDPMLRNVGEVAPPYSATLVPAHFPQAYDDPHGQDDLDEDNASMLRGGRSRRLRKDRCSRPRDDGVNPFAPPEMTEQRVDGRPVFNRDLYPGYDEYGNRRGLDHLRGGPAPSNVNYYRQRVHQYDAARAATPNGQSGQSDPGEDNPHIPAPPAVNGLIVDPSLLHPVGVPGTAAGLVFPGPYREKTIHEVLGLEPGTKISLDSLVDPEPGQKPEYTYATLVKLAIWSSPMKKLTLQEIYEAIENRFSWFKTCDNPNAWKTSIRHSLSLLAAFQKIPRHATDPGKGHYWTVDFSKGEGNKRIRKRNKKQAGQSKINGNGDGNKAKMSIKAANTSQEETEGEGSDSDDFIDPQIKKQSSLTRVAANSGTRAVRQSPYPRPPSSTSSYGHHRRGNTGETEPDDSSISERSTSIPPTSNNMLSQTPTETRGQVPNPLYLPPLPPMMQAGPNPLPGPPTRFGQSSFGAPIYASLDSSRGQRPPAFSAHASQANVSFMSASGADRVTPVLGRRNRRDDVVIVDAGGLPAARRVSRAGVGEIR